MMINLAYGQGHLAVELPDMRTTVIEPTHTQTGGRTRRRHGRFGKPHRRDTLRKLIRPNGRILASVSRTLPARLQITT